MATFAIYGVRGFITAFFSLASTPFLKTTVFTVRRSRNPSSLHRSAGREPSAIERLFHQSSPHSRSADFTRSDEGDFEAEECVQADKKQNVSSTVSFKQSDQNQKEKRQSIAALQMAWQKSS